MVSIVASEQGVPGFDSESGHFLWCLHVPLTVQKLANLGVRIIGCSELPVSVNVSVGGFLPLHVSPEMKLATCQGFPRLHPKMLR